MNVDELKRTWALVAAQGDDAPLFFYSHLFLTRPELREMFPVSMSAQRDKLFGALGHIVSNVDKLGTVTGYIQSLGSDHRRFDVRPEHYSYVGASLLATLSHYLQGEWTETVAADWAAAYGTISSVMVIAAEDAADETPAWWDAEVISVDRRSIDIAVVQLRLNEPMTYVPGQSMAMEIGKLPRLWRYVTPANAPRDDNTMELHIQLVPGGQFSSTAVRKLNAGDSLRFGAPVGEQLILPPAGKDLLMIAGGTGLAPLTAILDLVRAEWETTGSGRKVVLFHGARLPWNLYEQQKLSALAQEPWFSYHPVVSDDPTYPGLKGYVGTAAANHQSWDGYQGLVCGSPVMVSHAINELQTAGMTPNNISYENFSTADGLPALGSTTESGDIS